MPLARARLLTAVLLLLATAAFVAGTLAERHAVHEGRAGSSASSTTPEPGPVASEANGEASEATEGGASPGAAEGGAASEAGEHAAAEQETLLGSATESTPLVVGAALVSVLLAALVMTVPGQVVPVAVVLAGLSFAVLDAREVAHQLSESRPGLTVVAAAVAALHLLAAASAALLLRQAGRRVPA